MAKTPRIYERLTRPRPGLAMYSSLWLASDHLMLVRATGYNEQYQRFQLSDIQVFVVNPSHRRQNWGIAWAVLAVIALIPFVVSIMHYETPIVSGLFLALGVILLLINHLLGPTCRVSLVTRVQTARLPLVRKRNADKVLARLRPLIEAAQVDLSTTPAEPSAVPPTPFP